jgi:hypothetical protein
MMVSFLRHDADAAFVSVNMHQAARFSSSCIALALTVFSSFYFLLDTSLLITWEEIS